jgi:hypothetical protein
LLIEFDTSNAGGGATRLNGGEVYVGTFSGLADLIAADFGFLNATGNCGIARMQGLGDNAEDSGWFDCRDDHQEIDEPSSLALLGLGLGLLVLIGRRGAVRCG